MDTDRNLPLTIMILDVNELKLTNDAFGHTMGDQLLKIVAEIIKKACRADDIIGRMGGDEFTILLPKTDEKQADRIKQKIISIASKTKLEAGIVSLAVGYAVKTSRHENMVNIIKNADKDMYNNKKLRDGYFGSKTEQALIAFQKDQELCPDGILGPVTAQALQKAIDIHTANQQP